MGLGIGTIVGTVAGGPVGALVGSNYDATKANANAMRGAADASAQATIEAARIYTEAAKEAQKLSLKAAETRRTEDIAAAEEAARLAEEALVKAIPQIEAAMQSGVDQSNAEFAGALNTIRQGLQPYMKTGTAANERLNAMMFGSPEESGKAFQLDPGYAFRLKEGQKVRERSAAGRGDLFSGKTGIELEQYGQDYASNEFMNAFNRLMGLSTQGLSATNTMGAYDWQGAGVKADNAMKIAGTKAQNEQNLANLRGTNAWNVAKTAQRGNATLMDVANRGAWNVADVTGQGASRIANAMSEQAYVDANADMIRNNWLPETLKWGTETALKVAPMFSGAPSIGAGGGASAYSVGNAFNPNSGPVYNYPRL